MRSYLVVGNQTLDSPELAAAIRDAKARGPATFHMVVPATPVEHGLTWDEEEARANATKRLEAALDRLNGHGAEFTGEIGARDPVDAVRDAIRGREIDEIILSTLPPGISRWLGQDVPSRLKHAVTVPVTVVTTAKEPVPSS